MSGVFIIPITVSQDKHVVSGMIAFAHDVCSTKGGGWSATGCEVVVDADMVKVGKFDFYTFTQDTPRHFVHAQEDAFLKRVAAQATEILDAARARKWSRGTGPVVVPVACYPHLVQLVREHCFAWHARERAAVLEEAATRG